jgi:ABC-type Fe3+/spermidine/putrescine transport system ATPase subunit
MMFQSYALWPHLNVARNVAFGLEERGVDRDEIEERVAAALDMVHMGDAATRKINELSGGQQQRVALARALVVRPQCLLLDEPLSNLDAKLRTEMRSEVRRIVRESGLTAVYVTHDQKEALAIADRIAVMVDGHIAQVGTPQELYRNPASRAVADFVGETNLLEGTVEGDTSREHLYSVATQHGRFWGRITDGAWKPARGERVALSMRPECVYIAEEREARNSIHAKLSDAVYLGDSAQYVLRADDGTEVRVNQMNPVHLRKPSSQPVFAYIEPEDVVILRE